MMAAAFDPGRLGPAELAQLDVIEISEEPDAPVGPPRDPLRWLIGESGAAQAAFANDRSDPTGTAGLWRALGALSGGSDRDEAPRD
ncbi:MAG: hypothetical protein M3P14_03925 [Chloroflexota bacterium]|nr:hypothetical protein [Chloroflexota bacterium]